MRKMSIFVLMTPVLLFSLFANYLFAQENRPAVPDVSGNEWVAAGKISVVIDFDDGNDVAKIPFVIEPFNNKSTGVRVQIFSPYWAQEKRLIMSWNKNDASDSEAKIAIACGVNKWCVEKDGNVVFIAVVVRDKENKPIGIKIGLDTAEGLKEVEVLFH